MSVRISVSGSGPLIDIVNDDIEKTLLDLHGGLVLKTPVDTGVARAGWTVDTVAKVIENNVEYVEDLNNGHSQKVAAGFIETECDRAARLLP